MIPKIKPRERDAILQSLRAGVVPRIGLQHIQVGRLNEVAAVLADLDRISQGSATVRFVVGRFGSGKSFFLNLSRMAALQKRFVVVQADITPDRRLHASGGQARALFSELMRNMSAGARREGGALPAVVETWVSEVERDAQQKGIVLSDLVFQRLKPLQELVSGYDFASVIVEYVNGFHQGDEGLMSSAMRWLRAEYSTKTEARQDLGVRSIIDDDGVYDYLKLMASFVRMAGYAGLLVSIDEMGVLSHRLNSTVARNSNYEMILRIVNDCLQGDVCGLGFIFAGTDSFLDDPRRGLASYQALATRLEDNEFAVSGLKDYSGPVIRLQNLSIEELYMLFGNIRHVYASGDPDKYIVPDEAIGAFMEHCSRRLGSDFYRTPRDAVKSFVGLLSVIDQNPTSNWHDILGNLQVEQSTVPDDIDHDSRLGELEVDRATETDANPDGLATFRL